MPIQYMKVPEIASLVNNGNKYTKVAPTLLRLPHSAEIGKVLITYVKTLPGSKAPFTEETRAVIKEDSIIAENLRPVTKDIRNSWLIGWPDERLKSVYHVTRKELTNQYSSHIKREEITAIPITKGLVELFRHHNSTELSDDKKHEYILIQASWDPKVTLRAAVGGYLTTGGQPISEENMRDYRRVDEPKATNGRGNNSDKFFKETLRAGTKEVTFGEASSFIISA